VVDVFERASRTALVASVGAITIFQLAFHPDLTPALQGAALAALVLGALVGPLASGLGVAVWIAAAPLAPALLRVATGREGPVLDIVWMAGLAGVLLRAGAVARWSLPPLWRLLLGAWALVLSLAWPIVVARELNFHWHTLHDDAAVNSWALLTAARVVAWSLYVTQTQLLGLLWFDWLWGRFSRDAAALPRAVHALWLGVTLASVVAVYQGAIDLQFLSTAFWANERRAAGTLLDANGYGMLAALAAPVAAWSLRKRLPVALGVFAVNAIGLWMSGSRTALVGAVAGVVGLSASVLAVRNGPPSGVPAAAPRDRRTTSRLAAALVALVLVVGGLIAAGSAIGPLRRVADVPLSRAGLSGLWSRGGYGTIAVQMMRDTPWTGVGPGMYHVIAPDYWRVSRQMTLPFDNAQNWWRHQASELGALGALPLIVWSALVAGGVLLAAPREGRGDGWLPRALLAGIGFASLLGMPTQNPIALLWLFALVAWWSSASAGALAEGRVGPHFARPLAVLLLLLVALHAGGTAVLARGWLSVPERAKRAHRDYVVGAYDLEPRPGASLFRWTNGDARFQLAAQTRWLFLRLWVQHPDVTSVPVHVTVSIGCDVVFDEDLTSTAPVRVGVELPEGRDVVEATVRTSRTWQPAPEPPGDTRQLGVAVESEWLRSPQDAREQNRFVALKPCDS
jgi:hypothetical protein